MLLDIQLWETKGLRDMCRIRYRNFINLFLWFHLALVPVRLESFFSLFLDHYYVHIFVLDFQMLNSQITTAQHMEREKAYDIVSE